MTRARNSFAFVALLVAAHAAASPVYFNRDWDPNPWTRSLFGSRVTNRIDVFQWHEGYGRDTVVRRGQSGGPADTNANSHLHFGDLPYASTGGHASWVNTSLHSYSESNGGRSGTSALGYRWTENYTSHTVSEFWDLITLTNDHHLSSYVTNQIVVNGRSSRSGIGYIQWIFQPYSSWISASNWYTFRVEGFNGTRAFDWDGMSEKELAPMPHYMFPGQSEDYVIGMKLWTMTSTYMEDGPVHADFGNSAYFQLSLPQNVRMRSSSGAFVANPVTPVPEPATMAALGVGLVALVSRRSRR